MERNIIGIRTDAACLKVHHCPVVANGGEDIEVLDELCNVLYAALKKARKGMKAGKILEEVAKAMHSYEELYDI